MPEVNLIQIPDKIDINILPKFWKRIEPRVRLDNLDGSIQARICDPLWFFTRQWQMGEFKGDDAGFIIKAEVEMQKSRITHYITKDVDSKFEIQEIGASMPLEVIVEQEGTNKLNLFDRIRIGQQLERMMEENPNMDSEFISNIKNIYKLEAPPSDLFEETDDDTWNLWNLFAEKVIDGQKLIDTKILNAEPIFPNEIQLDLQNIYLKLWKWFIQLYPWINKPKNTTWNNEKLSYEIYATAPKIENEKERLILGASDYPGGTLDWYNFDIIDKPDESLLQCLKNLNNEGIVQTESFELIPTNVSFKGMPNKRWWKFEDNKVDFGNLEVSKTDMAKLMVMEFGLVYSNDWFIIPIELEIGSLSKINKLTVTDVFNQTIEIVKDGASGETPAIKDFNMFDLSYKNNKKLSGDFLFLAPSLSRVEKSPALEEVRFLRDEMANMCFAVEQTITNGFGDALRSVEYSRDKKRRKKEIEYHQIINKLAEFEDYEDLNKSKIKELLLEVDKSFTFEKLESLMQEIQNQLISILQTSKDNILKQKIINLIGAPPNDERDVIKYKIASGIRENWIPYIPVHTGNQNRTIQLRRAAFVDNTAENGFTIFQPRTSLLNSAGDNHFIDEEAVSRAGTKLKLNIQRARGIDGSLHLWIGKRKGPGKGEGKSGLKFDYFDK